MTECETLPAAGNWKRKLTGVFGLVLLAGSLGTDCAGGTGDEPIFPENYRETYQLVRDCRASIEHASTIRVWINDVGAAAYLADDNPLPVGTIVVKEEFEGIDCTDDSELVVWSVMRKESPGFDPTNNDWRFFEYEAPTRTLTPSPAQLCIDCHQEPDCAKRDFMCTAP